MTDQTYINNVKTTKPEPLVIHAMLPFLQELYGNPSSTHHHRQLVRMAIAAAIHELHFSHIIAFPLQHIGVKFIPRGR